MAPLPPVRGVEAPDIAWGLDIGEGDILPLICCGDLECRRGLPIGDTGHDIFLAILMSLGSRNQRRMLKYFLFVEKHF